MVASAHWKLVGVVIDTTRRPGRKAGSAHGSRRSVGLLAYVEHDRSCQHSLDDLRPHAIEEAEQACNT